MAKNFIFSLIVCIGMLMSGDVSAQTLGDMMNNISSQTNLLNLVAFLAYLTGALFAFVGTYKLYQHGVYGPQKVEIPEPLKHLFVGGLMLTLPSITTVVMGTFGDQGVGQEINDVAYWGEGNSEGLDGMLIRTMQNVYVPMQYLLTFFCIVAGAVLTMMAIHRFTKTEREGPRGPTGLGTIATFMLAGVLFSIAPSIGMFTETLFGGRSSYTTANFMSLIDDPDAMVHAEDVATAILVFLIIVGILSIIRGFFVLRGVAEGNQQMTMMSGISHVIAGAILVNFGQFANIVQNTLGLSEYGVLFN